MPSCMGFGTRIYPYTIPLRIFYTSCLFGGMLVYIVLTSFLLLLITIPIYEDQIGTIHEIIQKRFDLAGDAFALQHLRMQNVVNSYIKNILSFQIHFIIYLYYSFQMFRSIHRSPLINSKFVKT